MSCSKGFLKKRKRMISIAWGSDMSDLGHDICTSYIQIAYTSVNVDVLKWASIELIVI